jgi:hypothetical protein
MNKNSNPKNPGQKISEEILQGYLDFQEFLKNINLSGIEKHLSREDIRKLVSDIYAIKLRSLSSELQKLEAEMKLEEIPELKGVHNYPDLKEINFLSEEDKIVLDDYLAYLRLNSYIYQQSTKFQEVSEKWDKDIINKVFEFLLNKQIVEKVYAFYFCKNCFNSSKFLTQSQVNNYLKFFEIEKIEYNSRTNLQNEEFEELMNSVEAESCCMECDNDYEITEKELKDRLENGGYELYYRVIKKRDCKYDGV